MQSSSRLKRKKPLVQEVREELERMILGGDVIPGERLNEQNLAVMMGVSRAPVREAARSLEKDGLVTTVANQGVFVRKLSLDDALELYELRAMIFGYLCARVTAQATDDTIADLHAHVALMDEAVTRKDANTYFNENLAFHDRIAKAANSPRVAELYVGLCKEVRLMRWRDLSGQQELSVSNREHGSIVGAIESGDVKAASREGSQHHLNGKQRLLSSYGKQHHDEPA